MHQLYPRGVSVHMVEEHHVIIAASGYMGELSCLVGENGVANFVCVGKDIMYFLPTLRVRQRYSKLAFSGADSLTLSSHMPFFVFL